MGGWLECLLARKWSSKYYSIDMKAKLRRLHSADVDIPSYRPENPEFFGFFLQFFAGTENGKGDDAFGITVCTLPWLEIHKPDEIFFGKNYLIVDRYDIGKIELFLSNYCDRCVGDTWVEVASKIGRIAEWEFEDYREYKP
jgi:hypothetical protein